MSLNLRNKEAFESFLKRSPLELQHLPPRGSPIPSPIKPPIYSHTINVCAEVELGQEDNQEDQNTEPANNSQ